MEKGYAKEMNLLEKGYLLSAVRNIDIINIIMHKFSV